MWWGPDWTAQGGCIENGNRKRNPKRYQNGAGSRFRFCFGDRIWQSGERIPCPRFIIRKRKTPQKKKNPPPHPPVPHIACTRAAHSMQYIAQCTPARVPNDLLLHLNVVACTFFAERALRNVFCCGVSAQRVAKRVSAKRFLRNGAVSTTGNARRHYIIVWGAPKCDVIPNYGRGRVM